MLTRHLASELQYVLACFSDFCVNAVSKSLRLPCEQHFKSQKVVRDPGALTVLTSKSLSRHNVVQILATSWAADPPQLPFLGADFPRPRSHKTVEKYSILHNSYPPKPPHLTHHLSCITSARSHLLVDRSLASTLNIVGS